MKKQDISENLVNTVFLSLGSNLGNKILNLNKAKYLILDSNTEIIKTSNYYETLSWPNKKFPDYYNLILLVKTKLKLVDLFKKIKFIEKYIGRKDSLKNHPRVCDIDIIDFNKECLCISYFNNKINVPHISLHKRNFVLIPLYEINKRWIHPKSKKNIVRLISSLSTNDLRSIKVI